MKKSVLIAAGLTAFIGAPVAIASIGASLLPKPLPYAGPGGAPKSATKTDTPAPKLPTVPDGWEETTETGVFYRWCKKEDNCIPFHSDYGVSLIMWCKDRPCGDIYVQANLEKDDVIIGWTNDTGYGRLGDKVQLDLDTYQPAQRIQITEMNIRG